MHKEHNFKGCPFAYVKQTNVKWRITEPFPNGGDLTKPFPPEVSLQSEYSYEGKEYTTKEAIGAGIYLRHVWGKLIPAFYKSLKKIIQRMLIRGCILQKATSRFMVGNAELWTFGERPSTPCREVGL